MRGVAGRALRQQRTPDPPKVSVGPAALPKGGWTCRPVKRLLVGQLPFPLAAAPTALSPGGWLTRSRATLLPPFQTAVTGPVAISNAVQS
jgi:hypothetical protein